MLDGPLDARLVARCGFHERRLCAVVLVTIHVVGTHFK